jgi:leader peptidase (prepilin peptidase)/N-methyltransferase
MLYASYAILYTLVFVVGAVLGSFYNVVVYRLPKRLSFVKGFSFCPSCEHRLYPKDLVPLFGYVMLGGKCRYCGARISPRYFFAEVVCGAACLMCFVLFEPPVAALSFAVFSVLFCVTLIDADTQEIPDSLNIALLLCGIAAVWIRADTGLADRFIGIFAVSVPLLVIALVVNGAFGMGDVKLMAAAGFLLGWQDALVALFIAVVLGGAYGVVLLATRKKGRKDHFAFGPCLAVGIFAALLSGRQIMDWYFSLF